MEQEPFTNVSDLKRDIARKAEASIYSMNNPYLTLGEKTEVELWFQLPTHLAHIAFLGCAVSSIYSPIRWTTFLLIPGAVDLLAGLLLWMAYSRKAVLFAYYVVAHNWNLWLLTIVSVIWLLATRHWLLAALALLSQVLLSIFFGWHMVLYSVLSLRYGMHPKYAFFRRFYGRTFPFETQAS